MSKKTIRLASSSVELTAMAEDAKDNILCLVEQFYSDYEAMIQAGGTVELSLLHKSDGKLSNEAALAKLITFQAETGKPVQWEEGAYRFNFGKCEYSWNGKQIHLMAREQLYLFKILLLGQEAKGIAGDAQIRSILRYRLGDAFITELFSRIKSH